MRKNLTKKLFLSVLTLAFAVISLGASTYAWFVLSEDANVEAFSGTVQSGTSGLEIGVNLVGEDGPVQWRATSLDLTADLASIFTDFKFDAVQNANPLGAGEFQDINETAVAANGSTGKYLAFELYFRLADTNTSTGAESVYLTDYSMQTTGAENWFVNKTYKDANGDDVAVAAENVKYYVSDAARIAIVGADADHSLYLETHTYAGTDDKFQSEGKQSNGALSYYNAINSDATKSLPDSYENPTYGVTTKYDGKTSICELVAAVSEGDPNYEGSVVVYIWIDGWDGECINAIFGQTLTIDFKFSLNPKA